MNPDVASRITPLQAGLFNVVIYDEASQMPWSTRFRRCSGRAGW